MTSFDSTAAVTDDEISGEEKLRRVARLVHDLRADLKEVNFLPHERNAAMEQLKVFGRNAANADPIFTKEGIEILTQHSFHTTSPTTSKAALQCLANALLSTAPTRQIFVDLGYSPKAVARLKNPKQDDELLMSRILFLTSYGTTQSFADLIDRYHLADYINDNIARHAKRYTKLAPKKPPDPKEDLALSETLKLLFNITHFIVQRKHFFYKSVPSIFKILGNRPSTNPPLKAPLSHLINALLNFPLDSSPEEAKRLLPNKSDLRPVVLRLVSTLKAALTSSTGAEVESNVLPVLTLLKRIVRHSPPEIRALLRATLIPASEPLKSSSTLSSQPLSVRLINYLKAPITTQLHDAIHTLLFELVSGRGAEALSAKLGAGASNSAELTRKGQISSNPAYEASLRSLNSSDGRRGSEASRTPSIRDSAIESTSHSSASTISLGVVSLPTSSTPTSPEVAHSGEWASKENVTTIAEAKEPYREDQSIGGPVPEGYNIVEETRRAWQRGSKPSLSPEKPAKRPPSRPMLPKRKDSIDMVTKVSNEINDMSILRLDEEINSEGR